MTNKCQMNEDITDDRATHTHHHTPHHHIYYYTTTVPTNVLYTEYCDTNKVSE
jgi:hypothetical protein